jgi:hypothetical protein
LSTGPLRGFRRGLLRGSLGRHSLSNDETIDNLFNNKQ